jgi:hypothetical protein
VKAPSKSSQIRVAIALALFLTVAGLTLCGWKSFLSERGEARGSILEVLPAGLPGSCALIATEAYHRAAPSAAWAALLHLQVMDGTRETGHMVAVWKITDSGPVLCYDTWLFTGTTELDTRQPDANAIAGDLAKRFPKVLRGGAHFIQ